MELEPDLEVVGEAGSGLEAVKAAQALEPDVVVMDVEMGAIGTSGAPDTAIDGIAAAARIREVAPTTRLVMLTIHGDAATRARARAAGAVAFVEKQASVEDLLAEIRRAKAGTRAAAE